MTQVFHRRRKKYITRKHWTLQHAKTTVKRWKKSNEKAAFQICSTHVLFPDITSKKRQTKRQERTGHFQVHSKEEWNMFYDCVNIRVQSNRQFTQDLRQWHKSSIEAEKNISQGSIGSYNTPKQLRTGEKKEQKSRVSIMFDPCVIPKHHEHKTPDAETGEKRSFPRQLQRGVEHVWRWCEQSSAKQPTVYTRLAAMTQVFHRSRKNISQWSIGPYNTPKQLWTRKKSNKKIAFQICLTHVLFPKITSIKRQMQRQERTGHYHVHSKEELNMFYDGVDNRVQSNRQFTQDLRQWHKSSIEAEKISHNEALDLTTPKQLWTRKKSNKKIAFQICLTHVLFPKITSIKRQMQRQERTGHYHVHSKEEWNMFYDGVDNRVQSSQQFTQDLRQ